MKKKAIMKLVKDHFPDYSEKEIFSLILCGEVFAGNEKVSSHKQLFPEDSIITIKSEQYVSRGGYKLQTALDYWNYSPEGKVCIDAGSSTGGFTDCLLQHGAVRVYAVDVGFNQIAFKIRSDKRVVVMEKTNILSVEDLDPQPHIAVADLSFRSITGAAPKLLDLTKEKILLALIKPQFEILSHEKPKGFKGIVEDQVLLDDILGRVERDLLAQGCRVEDKVPSKIKGRKGNQEYLFKIVPV